MECGKKRGTESPSFYQIQLLSTINKYVDNLFSDNEGLFGKYTSLHMTIEKLELQFVLYVHKSVDLSQTGISQLSHSVRSLEHQAFLHTT